MEVSEFHSFLLYLHLPPLPPSCPSNLSNLPLPPDPPLPLPLLLFFFFFSILGFFFSYLVLLSSWTFPIPMNLENVEQKMEGLGRRNEEAKRAKRRSQRRREVYKEERRGEGEDVDERVGWTKNKCEVCGFSSPLIVFSFFLSLCLFRLELSLSLRFVRSFFCIIFSSRFLDIFAIPYQPS
jgi:hypothetical protein